MAINPLSTPTGLTIEQLRLKNYPFPLNSACDDGGVTSTFTQTSLTDNSRYWTPGIWQDALLIMYLGGQLYNTIISGNTINTLTFPSIPYHISITSVSYIIKRSQPFVFRPGIVLTGSQTLKQFFNVADAVASPFPFVTPLIAPAGMVHLVDGDTGLPMPFTVPIGHILTLIVRRVSYNQDCVGKLYYDGFFVSNEFELSAGQFLDETPMIAYSTALFDPHGLAAHTVDVQLINRGIGNMEGAITISAILDIAPQ